MKNTTLTDEQIMAYLDGELDDENRVIVEDAIKNSKEAQDRLNEFKIADSYLKQAVYDGKLVSSPSEEVQKIIDQLPSREDLLISKNNKEEQISILEKINTFFREQMFQPEYGMAAAVLCVGIYFGLFYNSDPAIRSASNEVGQYALYGFSKEDSLILRGATSPQTDLISNDNDELMNILEDILQNRRVNSKISIIENDVKRTITVTLVNSFSENGQECDNGQITGEEIYNFLGCQDEKGSWSIEIINLN